MALLTGRTDISTNINTMPPAMPTMPDNTLVANALRVISSQSRGEVNMGSYSSRAIYEKSDVIEYDRCFQRKICLSRSAHFCFSAETKRYD
jgi:hypothetical protein